MVREVRSRYDVIPKHAERFVAGANAGSTSIAVVLRVNALQHLCGWCGFCDSVNEIKTQHLSNYSSVKFELLQTAHTDRLLQMATTMSWFSGECRNTNSSNSTSLMCGIFWREHLHVPTLWPSRHSRSATGHSKRSPSASLAPTSTITALLRRPLRAREWDLHVCQHPGGLKALTGSPIDWIALASDALILR